MSFRHPERLIKQLHLSPSYEMNFASQRTFLRDPVCDFPGVFYVKSMDTLSGSRTSLSSKKRTFGSRDQIHEEEETIRALAHGCFYRAAFCQGTLDRFYFKFLVSSMECYIFII